MAWDFVSEEAGPTGEQSSMSMSHSPRHASEEHRGSLISFDVPPRRESGRGPSGGQEASSAEPVELLLSDTPPQQVRPISPSGEDNASPADASVSHQVGLEQVQEGAPEMSPQEKEEEHQGQAQEAEGGRTDDTEPRPQGPHENQEPQSVQQQQQQPQEQQADFGQMKTPGGQEEGNTNFN